MYYLIERDYELDDDQHVDCHGWFITTTPALGNMSHAPVIDGWAGTTCGWIVHGHGMYSTLEQARAALLEIAGPCREQEVNEWDQPDETVEAYLDGALEPLCAEATLDWANGGADADITVDSTDEDLDREVEEHDQEAAAQGYSLDTGALLRRFQVIRDELSE